MERFVGNWEVEVKSPMGGEMSPWEFFMEDGNLTGTMFLLGNSEKFGVITVDGDDFSCNPIVNSPIGKLPVKVTGKIDGTHIVGTADGGVMVMEFEGNKK